MASHFATWNGYLYTNDVSSVKKPESKRYGKTREDDIKMNLNVRNSTMVMYSPEIFSPVTDKGYAA